MDRMSMGLMGLGVAMYALFGALGLAAWTADNGLLGSLVFLGYHLVALSLLCAGAYRWRRSKPTPDR